MTRIIATLMMLMTITLASADEKFGPDDPVAAVDGKPVYLGELNLMLRPMARGNSIDNLPIDVQRAAAVVLVRRHLAMRALREKGGAAVDAAIDRYVANKTQAIQRSGSTVNQFGIDSKANEESLLRSWAWEAAWNLYVKTRLTEQNLRRFYQQHRMASDPEFDDLTDQSELRRDSTDALFVALVASQKDVKVQWFIPALRPPSDIELVPTSPTQRQAKP